MFDKQYENKNNIAPGIYQNKEIDLIKNKFFVNTDNFDLQYFDQLQNNKLNERIYYSPSNFPVVDYYDIRKGSIYCNYIMPTSAFQFVADKDSISVFENPTKISLDRYTDIYYELVEKYICKIYSRHNHVVLSFSGGIDSLVLLSYIIRLGYINRTTLLTHINKVQDYNSFDQTLLLRNNAEKQNALQEIQNKIKCCENIVIDITDNDVIDIINNNTHSHLKCYATATALKKFNNTAFIYGHHGNQSMIHKDIFVDQILLNAIDVSTCKEKIHKRLQKKDYYSCGMSNYDVNKTLTPLQYHQLLIKYWIDLDHEQNNTMYAPLGVNLSLCRLIDFKHIDVDVILNAEVAKELIHRNVNTLLDDYIITEGYDGDVYVKKWFNKQQFTNLDIPDNLNHNENGYLWLKDLLNKDNIELNSLISLKMLQQLSTLSKTF